MALWENEQYKASKGNFDLLCKNSLGSGWQGIDNYVNQLSTPLAKALSTSNVVGSGNSNGSNLVLQNLDTIMTSVLFQEEQLVKQRWIEKVPSINPIYQYNVRSIYGSSRSAMAFAEGSIGPVGNAAWVRNTAPVTFFGVQRGTTVIANIAGALGGMFDNPVQEEEYDGTLQLLGNVERSLVWGDSSVLDANGNTIYFDGFVKQFLANQTPLAGNVFATNVIDCHGKPCTFDVISKIAALAAKQYITSTRDMCAFFDPDTMQTFQLLKTEAERRVLGDSVSGGYRDGGYTAGTPIKSYDTPIGRLPFIQDVLLQPFDISQGGNLPLSTADSGAPIAVTTCTATAGAGTSTSNWQGTDAQTVYYTVSAFNASGESLPFTSASAPSPAIGQQVTVTITKVSNAYGYRVYRGIQSNGSDAAYIGQITQPSGATAAFVDQNWVMPGTSVGLVLNRNVANMVIAQMAPLLKLPLAIQNTTIPFGLLYLFTLAIKAIARQFIIINIGQTGYTL